MRDTGREVVDSVVSGKGVKGGGQSEVNDANGPQNTTLAVCFDGKD